jgi:polyisoprenoid-binding protein YceI
VLRALHPRDLALEEDVVVLRSVFSGVLLLTAVATTSTPLAAQSDPPTWRIDPTHSELTFRIRHYVTRVRGTFQKWQGQIVADPANLGSGSVDVTIEATSIDTNNQNRDDDLRSVRFFAVDSFPSLTFKSKQVEVSGEELRVTGDLTIRGITKEYTLVGNYLGVTKDAQGRDRIGFEASTKLNRLDHKVSWNRAIEGGGLMLGDEVEINITIEAVKAG